jgi:hypothetical protein
MPLHRHLRVLLSGLDRSQPEASQQAVDWSLQPVPRLDVHRMGCSTYLNLTFGNNILRRKGVVAV